MLIEKPHILSIHPTMQCDYHCNGCYLKRDEDNEKNEKSPEFFVNLIKEAKRLGMKEVAIPANYVDISNQPNKLDKNYFYFTLLKNTCKEVSIDFTCTVNYDFVYQYLGFPIWGDIKLMSVSINDYVTENLEKKKETIEIFKKIKPFIPNLNCNILVTPNMVKLLNNGLMEELLEVVDTVYLLAQKPIVMSKDKIKECLSGLDKYLDLIDDRIILDSCLKSDFGLTNGVCSRHQLIYVNPYGEVKKCSYDKNDLFKINEPKDLGILYNKHYPQKQVFNCSLLQHQSEK